MARIGEFRGLASSATPGGFERLLEELVQRARVDPERVVATAVARGLPVFGRDPREQLESLRRLPVEQLDLLARHFVRTNSAIAGAQGFLTNVGGLATWAVALPADTVGALYWVVRATSGVMASYGFEASSPEGAADLRLGLLVATGVNTVAFEGTRVLVEQVAQQALTTPASQRMLMAGARQMARRLGLDLTRGRVAKAVPIVGGALGGALNAGMVTALGRRARRHYRGRLLDWRSHQGVATGAAPPRLPGGALPLPPPWGPLPLPPGSDDG
ncbi:MAG: EcsC family protein [Euzebyales bacterium]|nr:EcsC family protein [Euzebyales bacterium]